MEKAVDEFLAAEDGAVLEVADFATDDLGDVEVAGCVFFESREFLFGGGFAHALAMHPDQLIGAGFFLLRGVGDEELAVFSGEAALGPGGGGSGVALVSAKGPDEAALGLRCSAPAADGFAVGAPAVVGGVLADSAANGVEVDVGGHGPRGEAALDDDAVESILPKSAAKPVALVKPTGVALQERAHELAEIVHAFGVAVEDGGELGLAECAGFLLIGRAEAGEVLAFSFGNEAGFVDFGLHGGDVGARIKPAEPMNELGFGEPEFAVGGWGRDFQEEVEVVGHDAIGEDAAAGEAFHHAHEAAKVLFFLVLKKELPVDDAGSDMVASEIGQSAIGMVGNDQPRSRHGRSLRQQIPKEKEIFAISPGNNKRKYEYEGQGEGRIRVEA